MYDSELRLRKGFEGNLILEKPGYFTLIYARDSGELKADTPSKPSAFSEKVDLNTDAAKVALTLGCNPQEIEYCFRILSGEHLLPFVRSVVERNFPRAWPMTEAALATVAQLFLEDQSACAALTFQGPPASLKTTVLSFFSGHPLTVWVDSFTPKAFVSHMASVSEEQLQEQDLLPQIRNKVLVVPELAPIFTKPSENLEETLGLLVRVFDGQGLSTVSGARGKRGYEGDYRFAWLAATTPINYNVWRALARLGSRWLFFESDSEEITDAELVQNVTSPQSYRERVEECRNAVVVLLDYLRFKHGGARSVRWKRNEKQQSAVIAQLARLLSHCRGDVGITHAKTLEGDAYFSFTMPVIEQPHRLVSLLYDLARGRALLYGRESIDNSDLPLVASVALASMPSDRAKLLQGLIENEGKLTSEDVQRLLKVSQPTASRLMELFSALGVVEKEDLGDVGFEGGRPKQVIVLNTRFKWLLDPAFRELLHARTPETVNKTPEGCFIQESQVAREQKVRFLKDCPEFLNSQALSCGPFKEGEETILPASSVQVLFKHGLVTNACMPIAD